MIGFATKHVDYKLTFRLVKIFNQVSGKESSSIFFDKSMNGVHDLRAEDNIAF